MSSPKEITVNLRETNLAAHAFYRECGFTCYGILREHYDDTGESAYLFRIAVDGSERRFTIKDASEKPYSGSYPKAFAIDEDDD